MSQRHSDVTVRLAGTPRHGHVFQPASRAYFAWQAGIIDEGALNQREAGKFFPASVAGLKDSFAQDDSPNSLPPADGKIASAGQYTGQALDAPGSHWRKHAVRGGSILDVSWHFTANHVTRRWNYFITRTDWEPGQPLSREQFEDAPFYVVQINYQPFWSHSTEMKPQSPTVHQVPLPLREGYHVLLAVWEVADTGNAFYQVVDLDFLPSNGDDEPPSTPERLQVDFVTDRRVGLSWLASSGGSVVKSYRITRNGITTVDIDASQLNWVDNSVEPENSYTYFVSAVDSQGRVSAPGRAVEVTTLPEGGADAGPSAPKHLHSMRETANSISLMWSASSGNVTKYLIYRDGRETGQVSGNSLGYEDKGLTPDSAFRYFVAASDEQGRLSVPSNVLKVKTTPANVDGSYPEWLLNGAYKAQEIVRHNGRLWRCLQAHVAYSPSWAPGAVGSETLWAPSAI